MWEAGRGEEEQEQQGKQGKARRREARGRRSTGAPQAKGRGEEQEGKEAEEEGAGAVGQCDTGASAPAATEAAPGLAPSPLPPPPPGLPKLRSLRLMSVDATTKDHPHRDGLGRSPLACMLPLLQVRALGEHMGFWAGSVFSSEGPRRAAMEGVRKAVLFAPSGLDTRR